LPKNLLSINWFENKKAVQEEIINRVASSPLITLDLEQLSPSGERVQYDLKDNLYQGIILKEDDFRAFLRENDWSVYKGKHVAVFCSEDAIIPHWAFMLLVSRLSPYAKTVVYGKLDDLEIELYRRAIQQLNPEDYKDKKIVVKGCGEKTVPVSAYMDVMTLLQPVATSVMFGEPCSTVPIYKKPKVG
jgi:hypothetical protein